MHCQVALFQLHGIYRLLQGFYCFDHRLLIPKINAHGLDTSSLYFLASYLGENKQRTKVNSSYSNFGDIFSAVPQGSILGYIKL